MEYDLIAPMLALMTLTFLVWTTMYIHRIGYMQKNRIHPDRFKTSEGKRLMDGPQNYAAENYNHLFEMPVLLYVLSLLYISTGVTDAPIDKLAWVYIALRAVHSIIHITYNKIMHRFIVFFVSSIVMFIMILQTIMYFTGMMNG